MRLAVRTARRRSVTSPISYIYTYYQTCFITQKPAKVVLSGMEVVAQSMGSKTHIRSYKMRVEGISADKTSYFSVMLEIFEVAPTFLMVDIQKTAGEMGVNTSIKFYKTFCSNLEDIIWKPPLEASKSKISKPKSKISALVGKKRRKENPFGEHLRKIEKEITYHDDENIWLISIYVCSVGFF